MRASPCTDPSAGPPRGSGSSPVPASGMSPPSTRPAARRSAARPSAAPAPAAARPTPSAMSPCRRPPPAALLTSAPSAAAGPVDVDPRHPRADARDDLVADGAGGVGPVLGRRSAVVAAAEQDGDVALGHLGGGTDVDDDLVHADPPAHPPARAAEPQRAGVAGV